MGVGKESVYVIRSRRCIACAAAHKLLLSADIYLAYFSFVKMIIISISCIFYFLEASNIEKAKKIVQTPIIYNNSLSSI